MGSNPTLSAIAISRSKNADPRKRIGKAIACGLYLSNDVRELSLLEICWLESLTCWQFR